MAPCLELPLPCSSGRRENDGGGGQRDLLRTWPRGTVNRRMRSGCTRHLDKGKRSRSNAQVVMSPTNVPPIITGWVGDLSKSARVPIRSSKMRINSTFTFIRIKIYKSMTNY